MNQTEGEFVRHTNTAGYFGRVIMEINESENNSIEIAKSTYSANEIVRDSWILGCEIGAKYALSKNPNNNYKIRVLQIIGTTADTNPTIIGTATILGIVNFLKIPISENDIENLTTLTMGSWNEGLDYLPEYK